MSRPVRQRLLDVLAALDAIDAHVRRGSRSEDALPPADGLPGDGLVRDRGVREDALVPDDLVLDDLVLDAVRFRLAEVGRAVAALPAGLLATEPGVPWPAVARMPEHLAPRHPGPARALVAATVVHELPRLRSAVHRLLDRVP